jgi:hypothetical protein
MLSAINPYAGLIGAGVSAFGQYRANKETRNYATKMSGTAHQRQMADLKAAGINPILAGRLGGASTPSYQAGNIGSAAVQGYGQVSSAKQAQAQTERTKVDTKIRQRDLDYLVKEGVSEYSVKYTVKNIFGSKMLNAMEMAFQGKADTLSQPYRAAANLLMDTLRKAGWVKGNTVINQKTKIEETENIFGFLWKSIGPGSKLDPHTWSK